MVSSDQTIREWNILYAAAVWLGEQITPPAKPDNPEDLTRFNFDARGWAFGAYPLMRDNWIRGQRPVEFTASPADGTPEYRVIASAHGFTGYRNGVEVMRFDLEETEAA